MRKRHVNFVKYINRKVHYFYIVIKNITILEYIVTFKGNELPLYFIYFYTNYIGMSILSFDEVGGKNYKSKPGARSAPQPVFINKVL